MYRLTAKDNVKLAFCIAFTYISGKELKQTSSNSIFINIHKVNTLRPASNNDMQ